MESEDEKKSGNVQHFQVNINILEGRHMAMANEDAKVVITIGKCKKTLRSKTVKTDAPYFNELCIFNFYLPLSSFLDEIIEVKLYGVPRIRRDKLIGSFSVELATVWTQPNHQFYHKWATLMDPLNPAAGIRGYLKCDIAIMSKGIISKPLDHDPAENIENHLLVPYGEVNDRQRAKIVVSVFRADNFTALPNQKIRSLYPYIRITYAGITAKTSSAARTFTPTWNEELAFTEMIPALCQYVHIEICDALQAPTSGVLGLANLDLRRLSHETENGFLPTYGPSFLYLHRNWGKVSKSNRCAFANNSVTYMCRLLMALRTEIVDYAEDVLVKKTDVRVVKPKKIPSLEEGYYFNYKEFMFFAAIFDILLFDASIITSKVTVRVNIGPQNPIDTDGSLKDSLEDITPVLKKIHVEGKKIPKSVTFDDEATNDEKPNETPIETPREKSNNISNKTGKLRPANWQYPRRLTTFLKMHKGHDKLRSTSSSSGASERSMSTSSAKKRKFLRSTVESTREWKPLKELRTWPTYWKPFRKRRCPPGCKPVTGVTYDAEEKCICTSDDPEGESGQTHQKYTSKRKLFTKRNPERRKRKLFRRKHSSSTESSGAIRTKLARLRRERKRFLQTWPTEWRDKVKHRKLKSDDSTVSDDGSKPRFRISQLKERAKSLKNLRRGRMYQKLRAKKVKRGKNKKSSRNWKAKKRKLHDVKRIAALPREWPMMMSLRVWPKEWRRLRRRKRKTVNNQPEPKKSEEETLSMESKNELNLSDSNLVSTEEKHSSLSGVSSKTALESCINCEESQSKTSEKTIWPILTFPSEETTSKDEKNVEKRKVKNHEKWDSEEKLLKTISLIHYESDESNMIENDNKHTKKTANGQVLISKGKKLPRNNTYQEDEKSYTITSSDTSQNLESKQEDVEDKESSSRSSSDSNKSTGENRDQEQITHLEQMIKSSMNKKRYWYNQNKKNEQPKLIFSPNNSTEENIKVYFMTVHEQPKRKYWFRKEKSKRNDDQIKKKEKKTKKSSDKIDKKKNNKNKNTSDKVDERQTNKREKKSKKSSAKKKDKKNKKSNDETDESQTNKKEKKTSGKSAKKKDKKSKKGSDNTDEIQTNKKEKKSKKTSEKGAKKKDKKGRKSNDETDESQTKKKNKKTSDKSTKQKDKKGKKSSNETDDSKTQKKEKKNKKSSDKSAKKKDKKSNKNSDEDQTKKEESIIQNSVDKQAESQIKNDEQGKETHDEKSEDHMKENGEEKTNSQKEDNDENKLNTLVSLQRESNEVETPGSTDSETRLQKDDFWSEKPVRSNISVDETDEEHQPVTTEVTQVRIYSGCSASVPQPVIIKGKHGFRAFKGQYPCIHINGRWPNALRRMYRSNVIQKSIETFASGLADVENELANGNKIQASEKLKKCLQQQISDCQELLSVTANVEPEDTNLYRERRRYYRMEIKEIIKTMEATSKKKILLPEELKKAYGYLTTLRKFAKDPEDSFPDTEIWLIKDGKNVAQHRMRTQHIAFSTNVSERGTRAGKVQSIIVHGMDGGVVAKLEMFMWFGLATHFIECRNMLPPGYETEPHHCRGTSIPNIPPLLIYTEIHYFQCRVHLLQAKLFRALDMNGLADPFIRVIIFDYQKESQIIRETLNPIWDEMLFFPKLAIYGSTKYLKENSITITIEVMDYDYLTKSELIGRAFLKPRVKLSEEEYDPPKLSWQDIRSDCYEVGKILLAVELLEVSNEEEEEEPQKQGKIIPIPDIIRPRSAGHRMEVLFWGVRELKKIPPRSTRVMVKLECAGKGLSSPIVKFTSKGLNFDGKVQVLELELPEDHEFKPPLIMKLFLTHPFMIGRETYAGNCIVPSVKVFFCTTVDNEERKHEEIEYKKLLTEEKKLQKEEKEQLIANKKPDKKQQWRKLRMKILEIWESIAVYFVKCYKWIKCKVKKSCVKYDADVIDYENTETLDWWVKYYASKEGSPDSSDVETLIIYDEELEARPEFGGFTDFIYSFNMVTGKMKKNLEDQILVGKVKAAIKLYRWPLEDNKTQTIHGVDVEKGVLKQLPSNDAIKYVARVYVVSCKNLTPKDLYGKSDPYLILQVGKQVINDSKNYIKRQVNPIIGRCYEFRGEFPKEHLLRIRVMDYDVLKEHDLIGITEIDLENRYYSKHHATCGLPKTYSRSGYTAWRDISRPTEILRHVCKQSNMDAPVYTANGVQIGEYHFQASAKNEKYQMEMDALAALRNWHEVPLRGFHLVPEHIETRPLYHPAFPGVQQGQIEMWIDIFPADFRYVPPIIDIKPRKAVPMELRAIIWNVEGVILNDTSFFFNEKMSDIYVKGWLNALDHDKQKTDVHYRSMNGEGNFNWRFVFPFNYIETERRLVLFKKETIFDTTVEEIKYPCKLELQVWDNDFFSDDFLGSLNLELSSMPRGAKISTMCKLNMFEETTPKINLFQIRRTRGWWPFRKILDEESSEYSLTGKIDLELEVLTEKEAGEHPVGKGREGPKPLPEPKRPESSFLWFFNPMKTFRYIILRKYAKHLIIILVLALIIAFVLLGIYSFPGYTVKKILGA